MGIWKTSKCSKLTFIKYTLVILHFFKQKTVKKLSFRLFFVTVAFLWSCVFPFNKIINLLYLNFIKILNETLKWLLDFNFFISNIFRNKTLNYNLKTVL